MPQMCHPPDPQADEPRRCVHSDATREQANDGLLSALPTLGFQKQEWPFNLSDPGTAQAGAYPCRHLTGV